MRLKKGCELVKGVVVVDWESYSSNTQLMTREGEKEAAKVGGTFNRKKSDAFSLLQAVTY